MSTSDDAGTTWTRMPVRALVPVSLVVLVALAVLLRATLVRYQSPDFIYFFRPWWDHLAHTGFAGLKGDFSSYNVAYLYLLYLGTLSGVSPLLGVKLISAGGDVLLALAIGLLIRQLSGRPRLAAAAGVGVLFLPPVLLNSAVWGQCDAIYTAFLIWSLAQVTADRHVSAWLLWGVAFAFKLQAVFLLPVLVIVWFVRRRVPWWSPLFGVVPLLVSWVPALIAGRSVASLMSTYVGQSSDGGMLAYAPNLWMLVPKPLARTFSTPVLVLAAAVIVGVVALGIHRRVRWSTRWLLYICLTGLLVAPFVLPHMRERYMFPAEMLAYAACFVLPREVWATGALLTVSTTVYCEQLFHTPLPFGYTTLAVLVLAILFRWGLACLGPKWTVDAVAAERVEPISA